MKLLATALFVLTSSSSVQTDEPHTYLASVEGIRLGADESIEAFAFETWGVRFKAVCRIPVGWAIRAGGSISPYGVLEGEGSNGVTWFQDGSPTELQNLVLIDFEGPMQETVSFPEGSSEIPATFDGHATIVALDGERRESLTHRNIRLVPADACPGLP